MSVAKIAQTVQFTPNVNVAGIITEIDTASILADTNIQALATNSVNGVITLENVGYTAYGVPMFRNAFRVTGLIDSTYVATVEGNLAGWNTAFPHYTVTTYGIAATYG